MDGGGGGGGVLIIYSNSPKSEANVENEREQIYTNDYGVANYGLYTVVT